MNMKGRNDKRSLQRPPGVYVQQGSWLWETPDTWSLSLILAIIVANKAPIATEERSSIDALVSLVSVKKF